MCFERRFNENEIARYLPLKWRHLTLCFLRILCCRELRFDGPVIERRTYVPTQVLAARMCKICAHLEYSILRSGGLVGHRLLVDDGRMEPAKSISSGGEIIRVECESLHFTYKGEHGRVAMERSRDVASGSSFRVKSRYLPPGPATHEGRSETRSISPSSCLRTFTVPSRRSFCIHCTFFANIV